MQKTLTAFGTVLILAVLSTHAFGSDDDKAAKDTKVATDKPASDKPANTKCPVMQGEDVSSKYFVDYNGQRVYLCCRKCVKKFQNDPEKYMKRLNDTTKPATASNRENSATGTPAAGASTKTGDDSSGKPAASSKKSEKEDDDDDDDDAKENSKTKRKKHDD